MSWLINLIYKDAQRRRFKPNDTVRFFTSGRKGRGRGIVLTPNFQKGRVVDFDKDKKNYLISTEQQQNIMVHPRNIMPEVAPISQPTPNITNSI